MTDNRKKKDPTRLVVAVIVIVVSFVLVMVLYNAISQKREYDQSHGGASVPASAAAASQ
jgi:Zn-dependent protease with chaperone function